MLARSKLNSIESNIQQLLMKKETIENEKKALE